MNAQQNLFNVPTSDVTEKKKLFFQQQLNITSETVQFNTTFSYGLGKGFEVGVNATGLNVSKRASGLYFLTNSDPNDTPLYPFYTLNAQKAFQLNSIFKVAIGTQTGLAGGHLGSYIYSNLVTKLPKTKTKIITGLYWASDSFLGPEDRTELLPGKDEIGTQIGIEQPIFGDRLSLVAENISGTHTLGETSLGGAYRFTKHWVFSSAWLFPNVKGRSSEAWVVEFTYMP